MSAIPATTATADISVIIPIYNAARSIKPTFAALEQSSLRPQKIICVDDGSTDQTPEVIQRFAASSSIPVHYYALPRKGGAAMARNYGVQRAGSEYLLFVDSDVVVEYTTIQQLHALLQPPYSAVVATYRDYSLQSGILAHFQAFMVSFVFARLDAEDSPYLGTQCVLMRAETFRAANGFDESFAGATVEDFEFGYRLRAQGQKVRIAREAGIIHNHHYTWRTFLANYYRKARDLAFLLFSRRPLTLEAHGYHEPANIAILALVCLSFANTAMALRYDRRLLWLAGLVPVAIFALWQDFIRQAARRWGHARALLFVLLRIVVVFMGCAGIFAGLRQALSVRPALDVIETI